MELSKMFGVEREEWFMVEGGGKTLYKISAVEDNIEFLEVNFGGGHGWEFAKINMLLGVIDSAPAGIIHLPPPLTDEQREQLKAIWTLGGRYLAKDSDGVVNYYTKIPYKDSGYWFDNDDAERYGYAIPLSAGVCELQELNDVDEPFDIGKALGVTE